MQIAISTESVRIRNVYVMMIILVNSANIRLLVMYSSVSNTLCSFYVSLECIDTNVINLPNHRQLRI